MEPTCHSLARRLFPVENYIISRETIVLESERVSEASSRDAWQLDFDVLSPKGIQR
jgi:hypothetical protein